MSFHVGQQIVCVTDKWTRPPRRGEVFPVKGQVYTVRELTYYTEPGLRLAEIKNPEQLYSEGVGEIAFMPPAFRPVKTTDISIFTAMLAPTKPELVE